MSREDARTAIVEWFENQGLLDEVREYTHSVGHSYRSHVPIEPWLSDQWYVRVTDDRLRGAALRAQDPEQAPGLPDDIAARSDVAGDGDLRFSPERYARTYQAWHENIRDWCISRQLWWGHQIPVWMRLIDEAATTAPVQEALEGVGIDELAPVDSRWRLMGASHCARRVTATEVEEAICIPPDATLRRSNAANATAEEELVAAVESAGYTRDPTCSTPGSRRSMALSTMGWPWPADFPETAGLLESFNPTSVLATGRDIITLWVSRMVMFNRYFSDGDVPFADVYINTMIQDGHGQRMSKSLGNGVDPNDIIHSHGADAMRFGLVQLSTETQDVRMPVDMVCPHSDQAFTPEFIASPAGYQVPAPIQQSPSDPDKLMVSAYGVASGLATASEEMPLARNTSPKFDLGRNFANKVWNATRFAIGRLEGTDNSVRLVDIGESRFADRWIIARLHETVEALNQAIGSYHFNEVANTLYDFIWRDVCDRYLEAIKSTIDDDPDQQVVLGAVLDAVLRLLHPVCPFVTETLWPHVSQVRSGDIAGVALPSSELVTTAAWPVVDGAVADASIVADFERADSLVGAIRTVRSEQQVKPRRMITMHAPESILALLEKADGYIESLAGIETVETGAAPAGASPLVFEGAQLNLSDMVDAADAGAEVERLTKKADELRGQIGGLQGRLANKGYVDNAPAHLVDETRAQLAAAEADLAATEAALAALA